jgi:hypothetical protein
MAADYSPNGIIADYDDDNDPQHAGYEDSTLDAREQPSNVHCGGCKDDRFYVNYLCAPYTGGFFKVTCCGCGAARILLDDFS